MQLLLDAAIEYESRAAAGCHAPPLIIVITGKGPDREAYLRKIAHMHLAHVAIFTAWVPAVDYAPFLACADLGVSLHVSSSGLDLPMKVSDMLGWCARSCSACLGCTVRAENFAALMPRYILVAGPCPRPRCCAHCDLRIVSHVSVPCSGLPVCAFDYDVAHEQARAPSSEMTFFRTAEQLAGAWIAQLGSAQAEGALGTPRRTALLSPDSRQQRVRTVTWELQWQQVMPLVLAAA